MRCAKQFVGKMSAKTAPWTSDIWAEYARLKSLGWTQQRIAKAKGVSQQQIATEIGCAIGTVNRVLSQFSAVENWDSRQGMSWRKI